MARAADKTARQNAILMGVYGSSMGISLTALTIVAVLEVFMLVYSVVNAPMYGGYLQQYRFFYITQADLLGSNHVNNRSLGFSRNLLRNQFLICHLCFALFLICAIHGTDTQRSKAGIPQH